MKYIRTKDSIYESSKIIISIPPMNTKKEEIKSADNIEELCDEFVFEKRLIGKSNVDFESKSTYVSKGGFIPFSDWNYEIYAAIWTDKGLIYVAKMNDKGELVLL